MKLMKLSELPQRLFNPTDAEVIASMPSSCFPTNIKGQKIVSPTWKCPFTRAHGTFKSSGLTPVAFAEIAEVSAADVVKYAIGRGWQVSLCTAAWTPILAPSSGHAFYDMYSGEAKKWNAVRGGYNYSNCTKPDCEGCRSLEKRTKELNEKWEPLPESLGAFLDRFGDQADFCFSPYKFGKYYHGARHFESAEECFAAVKKAFWLGEKSGDKNPNA